MFLGNCILVYISGKKQLPKFSLPVASFQTFYLNDTDTKTRILCFWKVGLSHWYVAFGLLSGGLCLFVCFIFFFFWFTIWGLFLLLPRKWCAFRVGYSISGFNFLSCNEGTEYIWYVLVKNTAGSWSSNLYRFLLFFYGQGCLGIL